MGKYTNKDVKWIAQAMRRCRDDDSVQPYSLLIGAGCSFTAGIPLAGKLVEEIKKECKPQLERQFGPDLSDDYGDCMSALTTNERKTILEPYLSKAGVNWGHIAIAAMMEAGYVGRVLTFNFDSVLARACGLLGLYPATYDYARSISNRTDHIATPAILHLHGQGHSLTMLNSRRDTEQHAQNLRPLLSNTLSHTPLLVAGYSGKSDAVFKVLAELYDRAERLHWVGFDKECDSHIAALISDHPETCEYLGGADSDEFFMALARALECWPPKLFNNPYEHLLDELEPVTDYPDSDTDILTTLKAQLKEQADAREQAEDSAADLLLDGDWDGVIALIGDNPSDPENRQLLSIAIASKADAIADELTVKFDPTLLAEMNALYGRAVKLRPDYHIAFNNWGNSLSDLAEQTQDEALFRESFDKYAKAIEIKPNMHEAFNNWGIALKTLAEQTQDEALFRESFDKYAKAVEIKPDLHEAFNNWGLALHTLAEQTQDETLFRESFDKYAKAVEIKPDKHEAFNNWGIALKTLAEQTQDETLYRDSFDKYAKAIEIKPDMHEAFNNWGIALKTLAVQTQDETLFRESFDKYAKAVEIKPDLHEAFNNWGLALHTLAEQTQDETLFRDSFDKYAKAIEIKPDKHEAFNNWGLALQSLAAQTQDEALFRDSFDKYAKAVEIKPDMHEAFYNWGNALAKAFQLTSNNEYLSKAVGVLEKARALNPDKLYNLACLYALKDRRDDAIAALLHCEETDNLPNRTHLEADVDLDNLRADDRFIALSERQT